MGLIWSNSNKEVKLPPIPDPVITAQDKADIAQLVISNLPAPEITAIAPGEAPAPVSAELSEEDRAYLKDVSDLDEEKQAEMLVLAEIETKDFKKTLRNFLNDEGAEIESYKDIFSIVVDSDETDVDVTGEDGSVELTFKTKYFEDGDSDEEDLEAAKVSVICEVSGLDSDDEFEDAEVEDLDSCEFNLIKFYDN